MYGINHRKEHPIVLGTVLIRSDSLEYVSWKIVIVCLKSKIRDKSSWLSIEANGIMLSQLELWSSARSADWYMFCRVSNSFLPLHFTFNDSRFLAEISESSFFPFLNNHKNWFFSFFHLPPFNYFQDKVKFEFHTWASPCEPTFHLHTFSVQNVLISLVSLNTASVN